MTREIEQFEAEKGAELTKIISELEQKGYSVYYDMPFLMNGSKLDLNKLYSKVVDGSKIDQYHFEANQEKYAFQNKFALIHRITNIPSSDQKEFLEFLIKNGADINLKTEPKGFTALMLAIKRRDLNYAKLLIGKGANLNEKNMNGNTAFEMQEGSFKKILKEAIDQNNQDLFFKLSKYEKHNFLELEVEGGMKTIDYLVKKGKGKWLIKLFDQDNQSFDLEKLEERASEYLDALTQFNSDSFPNLSSTQIEVFLKLQVEEGKDAIDYLVENGKGKWLTDLLKAEDFKATDEFIEFVKEKADKFIINGKSRADVKKITFWHNLKSAIDPKTVKAVMPLRREAERASLTPQQIRRGYQEEESEAEVGFQGGDNSASDGSKELFTTPRATERIDDSSPAEVVVTTTPQQIRRGDQEEEEELKIVLEHSKNVDTSEDEISYSTQSEEESEAEVGGEGEENSASDGRKSLFTTPRATKRIDESSLYLLTPPFLLDSPFLPDSLSTEDIRPPQRTASPDSSDLVAGEEKSRFKLKPRTLETDVPDQGLRRLLYSPDNYKNNIVRYGNYRAPQLSNELGVD